MNRPTMQNDENAVIRYLMKEMDPSEEVLMERAMMEDDDLLIEVESMRQTLTRLDDLPEKEPPQALTESIVEQAADHQKRSTATWNQLPSEVYKYAAVLLIGMGLGSGIWMFMDSAPADQAGTTEAAITTTPGELRGTSAAGTDAEPWVDRDDVIYFQDMFSPASSGYNSIMQASMDKLTPVDPSTFRTDPNARNVQLTGTGSNN